MPHVHAFATRPGDAAVTGSGLVAEDLLQAYLDRLAATGRGNAVYERAARKFLRTWPDPEAWAQQPLADRLAAGSQTRPLITYLMVHQGLRPGFDYLLERKLSSIWREIQSSWLQPEIDRFLSASEDRGFSLRVRLATGSQVPVRLLIQTGRPITELTQSDLDAFAAACHERGRRTGTSHSHYLSAISTTQTVLYHLGVVDQLPRAGGPIPLAERLAEITPEEREVLATAVHILRRIATP